MKNLLASIAFLIVLNSLIAQSIPNAGFENWTNHGIYSDPTSWCSFNQFTASSGIFTCEIGSPGAVGSSYVKLTTKQISGVNPTSAIVSSAQSFAGIAPGFECGVRPQYLTGQYKSKETGNDTAYIEVLLSKWNSITLSRNYVGIGNKFIFAGTISSWTPFSIPLNYLNGNFPDSALIMMSSSSGHNAANYVANDYLYVDDLAFSGSVPAGIDELTQNTNITISPNPTTGELRIQDLELGIKTVNVYNVLGELVQSLKLESLKLEVVIDVSRWKAGVYFVEVETEKGVVRRKVIKE
ncbi:MAG: T9SS type A sorting domain-containing protein [Bacteroidota bacterium]